MIASLALSGTAWAQGADEEAPPQDAAPAEPAPSVKDPKVVKTWQSAGDTLVKKGDALAKQGKADEAKTSYENAVTAYGKAIDAGAAPSPKHHEQAHPPDPATDTTGAN